MTFRIVKQPNDLLAIFDTVVDTFTWVNMTEKEAVKYCEKRMGKKAAKKKVNAGINDMNLVQTKNGSGLDRWTECMNIIKNIHGVEEINNITKLIIP